MMGRELIGGAEAQALLDADSRAWFQVCVLGCEGSSDDHDSGTGVAPVQEEWEDVEGLKGSARECYDLHLAPFYSNLCSLFLVPLFSDHAGAEELASELLCVVGGAGSGSALPPGAGRWLADLVSNPLPPALLLRVVLLRLRWTTPEAHPDWQVHRGLVGPDRPCQNDFYLALYSMHSVVDTFRMLPIRCSVFASLLFIWPPTRNSYYGKPEFRFLPCRLSNQTLHRT